MLVLGIGASLLPYLLSKCQSRALGTRAPSACGLKLLVYAALSYCVPAEEIPEESLEVEPRIELLRRHGLLLVRYEKTSVTPSQV